MTSKISPCIFVGLGTTGLRILEELRKLVYEEYGVAGLPCFRYIVIETNQDSTADDLFIPYKPASYEQIKLIHIPIPDLDSIKTPVKKADWLDPKILSLTQRSFIYGAGHRRQIGRLCLWENWSAIEPVIIDAVRNVNSMSSRKETETFLKEKYFPRKHIEIENPNESLVCATPDVYIVGTLCGGTCSGTFIDIAYTFHHLLTVRSRRTVKGDTNSDIIGIFTIPDRLYAKSPPTEIHLASCWAALTELDYYTRDDTVYTSNPSGKNVSIKEPPFSTVYLVSKINSANVGLEQDTELEQMCAMNLFTEVVAGMASVKMENRVNIPAAGTGYLEINTDGYIRAFNSFGLSAAWYPRYRIEKATVRRIGLEVLNDWIGDDKFNKEDVYREARKDWDNLLSYARNYILRGSNDLIHLLNQLFDSRSGDFNELPESAIADYLADFPNKGNTLSMMFMKGGEYYRNIESASKLLNSQIEDKIKNLVSNYFRNHTSAEAKQYVSLLEQFITETLKGLPRNLPEYSQRPDMPERNEVFNNFLTKILFMRKKAIEEYKDYLWDNFKQKSFSYLNSLCDQFLINNLENLLNIIKILKTRVNSASSKMLTFKITCQREYEESIEYKKTTNIVIFSQGKKNSIKEDVEIILAKIMKNASKETLRSRMLSKTNTNQSNSSNEEDPLSLFERRYEDLISTLDVNFTQLVKPHVESYNIGQKLHESGEPEINNFVNSSAPYFEPSRTWVRMITPQDPNFVFSNEENTGRILTDIANKFMIDAKFVYKQSPIEHFIFFYQEIPGLALSDFDFLPELQSALHNMENDTNQPTQYTHRLGRVMFDQTLRIQTARQWIIDMKDLAPELFQSEHGDCVLRYKDHDGLIKDIYLDDEESLKEHVNRLSLPVFIEHLASRLRSIEREELVKRMNDRKSRFTKKEDREQIDKRHAEILKAYDAK